MVTISLCATLHASFVLPNLVAIREIQIVVGRIVSVLVVCTENNSITKLPYLCPVTPANTLGWTPDYK